ncbi:pyridoxamine 5'-phosphate oxidase domain-containing protein [Trichoderma novae-zelandiae]
MGTLTAPVRRTKQLLNHLGHTMVAPEAPWRSAFLAHVQQAGTATFALSTLHPLDGNQFVPRARTVVFRGMWASLPENPRNPAPLNPAVYTSDLPTITTDVRMDKVPELMGSRRESSASPEAQSAAGGPVEAVFWMEKASVQWRFRGRAYVIGPDIDSEAAAHVRAALQPWMRLVDGQGKEEWSWSRELTASFGNLSPLMRGSFRHPQPGTPLTQKPEPGLELGQEVEDVNDELARKNFRVLVIMPEEIDQIDLSDPRRGRRWSHKVEVSESAITWKTTELWP